jgi:hypothetical protein
MREERTAATRSSWRRTMGHAGVYLAVAGAMLARVRPDWLLYLLGDEEKTQIAIYGGALLLLGVVLILVSIAQITRKKDGRKGISLSLMRTGFSCRLFWIDYAPYWLGHTLIAYQVFFMAIFGSINMESSYAVFGVPSFMLYCVGRGVLYRWLKARPYVNLLLFPLDLILLFVLTAIQLAP